MPRSRSEIQADIDRLNAEFSEAVDDEVDTLDELDDVIEEAAEAREEATEDAVDAVEDAIEDAIEEATEEAQEGAEEGDITVPTERDIVAEVVERLANDYGLTPVVTHEATEEATSDVIEETAPVSEHWAKRRIKFW